MNRLGMLPVLAGLLLPMMAQGAVAAPGQAVPAKVSFAIPPQALATALIAFGRQANVQVLTAAGRVDAVRSPGVTGSYAPAEALARLLHGLQLDYRFIDAGTVVVKPASTAAPGKGRAASGATGLDVRQLAPVVATGVVDDGGYLVDTGSGATRVDTDLVDLPASVSEVPHDLLDSQQALSVADAVRNVAGVQYLDGSDALPVFLVRGFQVGNGMIDGLPNSIVSYGDFPPLIGIERVEVLKGPQAIIGDASVDNNFGGLINLVLKQPTAVPVARLETTLGQYGGIQSGLDLGGPLGRSGHWTYRLIASGEYGDRTRQGRRGQRDGYLAPSIGWRSGANHLVVSVQRLVRNEPIPDHAVMLDDTLASTTSPGVMTGNPGDHSLFRTTRFAYAFEHRFDSTWTLRSRGQYVRQQSSVQQWDLDEFTPQGDASAFAEKYRYHDAFWTMQNDVVGRFGSGAVRQVVVAGFDYSRALSGNVNDVFGMLAQPGYNIRTSPPLPAVGTVTTPALGLDLYAPGTPWSGNRAWFVQDQFALGDHWNALLALRRTAYALATEDAAGNPITVQKSQWVPNAGLLYKLTPALSVYASATSGFQSDEVLGKNGQPLPPSRSRQLEAGAKWMLFGQHAMLTAAVYRIMLDHSTDLSSPKPPYYGVPGPGQDNRGVELEFNGRVLPGLDVSAAYTDARVSNHDGSPAIGTPRQRFNLWASYRFQGGALRGWGVAGGVLARSASRSEFADNPAYFSIPGQASVDANVSWRGERWGVTLGVRNLFDRRLEDALFDETFVPLHRGRQVLLSFSRDFLSAPSRAAD